MVLALYGVGSVSACPCGYDRVRYVILTVETTHKLWVSVVLPLSSKTRHVEINAGINSITCSGMDKWSDSLSLCELIRFDGTPRHASGVSPDKEDTLTV